MSNTLQYLDYEGLKYYDKKLKESLKEYMPKDGSTPTIGANGNWYIDGEDTGVKAEGATGATGATGASVTITSNSKVDGVTTVTFSDGNTIKINDGEDADETDLQLGEEIKTNVACGALGCLQLLFIDQVKEVIQVQL